MINVVNAESAIAAFGLLQAYPVLMRLQHGVIEKSCTAPVVWKFQLTTNSRHNIKGCSPDVHSLPFGLPHCSALLDDGFLQLSS